MGTLQHGFDQGEFGEFNVIVYDKSGKSGASIAWICVHPEDYQVMSLVCWLMKMNTKSVKLSNPLQVPQTTVVAILYNWVSALHPEFLL